MNKYIPKPALLFSSFIFVSCSGLFAPRNSLPVAQFTDETRTAVVNPYTGLHEQVVNVPWALKGGSDRQACSQTGKHYVTPGLHFDEMKRKEGGSSGFDDLMKGAIAVGGAAVLADGGVSSSQISQYAAGVINDDPHQALGAAYESGSSSSATGSSGNILGRWIDQRNSNVFVFRNGSGEFIQSKPVNGNPGTVIIYFTWKLSADTSQITINKKKIRLRGSNGYDQTSTNVVNPVATNSISSHGAYILIDGVRFNRN